MTISTHSYSATLIGHGDPAIDVKSGTITLDAGRAPHVQASIVIGTVSQAVFTLLDPRLLPRLAIHVDAVTPVRTVTRDFDLGVRARPIRYLDGDYGLELASDEALLTDYAPMADDTAMTAVTNIRTIVNHVLDVVIPGEVLEPGIGGTMPADADPEARIWKAGDMAMSYLQPILEVVGLRLVCDEQRKWTLRAENYVEPGTILVNYRENLIDADETMDRDNGFWFDSAVTRYSWTDSAGVAQTAVDSYRLVTPHTKTATFDLDKAFPGTGFSAYAVRRAQGRGREVNATAVADWRAKCEQELEFRLPGTPVQTGTSQSITFDLSSDEMTVSGRTIDTPDGAIDLLDGTIDGLVGTIDAQVPTI